MAFKRGKGSFDHFFRVGYAYGQPDNRYWVVSYRFKESTERYERVISDPFVNKDFAIDYFRTISVSKDVPRVEIWYKLKGKRTKLMTYKGLE